MRRIRIAALSLAAGAVALTGSCGGGSSPKPSSSPSRRIVAVTLQEWAVIPAPASIPAGIAGFQPTNKGPKNKHELLVVRTSLTPDKLPLKTDGSVNEKGAGLTLIGRIGPLEVGSAGSNNFTLAAGDYVLFCNLVTKTGSTTDVHYKLGMRIAFKVT